MSGEVGVDGFVDTSANGKWWALEALYVEGEKCGHLVCGVVWIRLIGRMRKRWLPMSTD